MAEPTSVRSARNVAGDHRAIRSIVTEIRSALGGRGPRRAMGPDVVAARLDQLRGQLGAHFDEEERSGLFDQIVAIAPEQEHACARLRAEHLELLALLDGLRAARVEARRDPAWTADVRALLESLGNHESHENDLLIGVLDGGSQAQD